MFPLIYVVFGKNMSFPKHTKSVFRNFPLATCTSNCNLTSNVTLIETGQHSIHSTISFGV